MDRLLELGSEAVLSERAIASDLDKVANARTVALELYIVTSRFTCVIYERLLLHSARI